MAGSIQSDINQALGTAGVLLGISGAPQKMQEGLNLRKRDKITTKQLENVQSSLKETGKELARVKASGDSSAVPGLMEKIEAQGKEVRRLSNEDIDVKERIYQLNPNKKNYEAYMEAKSLPDVILPSEDPDIIHRTRMDSVQDEARRKAEYNYAYQQAYRKELSNLEMQQQAMDKMSRQSEAKKEQRRNFMDYISKMPTLGETVGSIDARHPGFAKKIAAQYNEKDRKRIMNQMDKEESNGKSN